jgi:hypothetical protein
MSRNKFFPQVRLSHILRFSISVCDIFTDSSSYELCLSYTGKDRWPVLLNHHHGLRICSLSFQNDTVIPAANNYSWVLSTSEEVSYVNGRCLSQCCRTTRARICNYKVIKNSKHIQEHVALIPEGVRKQPTFESRQSEVARRDQESKFHAEDLTVVLLK